MLRVTVDTNVLDRQLERVRQAAEGLEVEIALTTVTLRERGITKPPDEDVVMETGVWNESRWNEFVWGPSPPVYESAVAGEWRARMAVAGAEDSATRFEEILKVIGSGSFPPLGKRDELNEGQQHQLRDAMILEAHAREARDVLVSDDSKAFIGKTDEKRPQLEALCRTKILTVDEFCAQVAVLADLKA